MSSARTIARDTALLTAGQLVGLLLNFAGMILIARALGPEGRGVYAWVLIVASFAIQLANLAPPAVVRAIAERSARDLSPTLALLSALGACATLPFLALALSIDAVGAGTRALVAIAWLAVPLSAATLALFTLVQISGRPFPILTVQIAPRVIQLALVVLLLQLGSLNLTAAVWMFPAAALIDLLFVVAALGSERWSAGPSLDLMRSFAASLGAGWVANFALYCMPRVGFLALGVTASLATTGQYSVALTLQEVALTAPVVLGQVLITRLSRRGVPVLHATFLLGGMAAICAICALTAPLFIRLAFGPAFAPAAEYLRALLVAVLCGTLYQICLPVLYRSGSAARMVVPAFGALLVAAGLALTIPRMGVGGAILSNLVGFATLAGLALSLSRAPRGATAVHEPLRS